MLGQGVSDPYATISFLVDNTLNRFKTFIIKDNLNPEWNFLCQTPVEHLESVSDINIRLFDKDDFSKDDNLGEVSVPKSVIKRSSDQRAEQDFWLMLTNTEKGSVRTKVSWSTLSTTPPLASPSSQPPASASPSPTVSVSPPQLPAEPSPPPPTPPVVSQPGFRPSPPLPQPPVQPRDL